MHNPFIWNAANNCADHFAFAFRHFHRTHLTFIDASLSQSMTLRNIWYARWCNWPPCSVGTEIGISNVQSSWPRTWPKWQKKARGVSKEKREKWQALILIRCSLADTIRIGSHVDTRCRTKATAICLQTPYHKQRIETNISDINAINSIKIDDVWSCYSSSDSFCATNSACSVRMFKWMSIIWAFIKCFFLPK